jgi:hypothetical protein
MIYLVLLNFILLIGVFFYLFKKEGEKHILSIDLDYPKSIVKPFEFKDLDDFETSIIDILNLVINENWKSDLGYYHYHYLLLTNGNIDLLIKFDKVESGDKFEVSFNGFDFGGKYDYEYRLMFNPIINFRESSLKDHKNLKKVLNKFIHHYVYNNMLDIRNSTKLEIFNKKSKLDEILISVRRNRRIDDILNK